jgi:hypothetical protein
MYEDASFSMNSHPTKGDAMAAKYELKKTESGKYVWNLKAGNGEVILTSQQYADKRGAEGGIESVRKNCKKETQFEKKTASNGQPYFTLIAANKEIIGKSEMYSSVSAMQNGISSVMKNASEAKIEDLTS